MIAVLFESSTAKSPRLTPFGKKIRLSICITNFSIVAVGTSRSGVIVNGRGKFVEEELMFE